MAASRPTPYTDQIVFCFVLFFVVVVAVESGHRIRPSRTGRNKTFAFYLNLFDLWRKGEILLFLFFLIFIYFFLRFWLHSIFTTVSSFCKKKEEAYHTHTHTHTKFTIEFDFLSCFLGFFFFIERTGQHRRPFWNAEKGQRRPAADVKIIPGHLVKISIIKKKNESERAQN